MTFTDTILDAFESYASGAFGAVVKLFTAQGSFLSPIPILFAGAIAGYVIAQRLRRTPEGISLRSFTRALFPKHIYEHPSARRDLWVILINEGLLFFIPAIAVVAVTYFRTATIQLVGAGEGFAQPPSSDLLHLFLFGVYFTLVWDFFATYAHYLKHKLPMLWEFHKVHHCAEVLTPLTAMRRHPVEIVVGGIIVGAGIAMALVAWVLLFGAPATSFEIAGQAAAIYMWRLLGYNIRHSHLWISYGQFWNRIFVSPAHHQLHHSRDPRHHDCNFGHIFSFWDAMFGTLYHPREGEEFELGIEREENEKLRTLRALYFRPLAMAARQLVARPLRTTAAETE